LILRTLRYNGRIVRML